MVVAGLIPDDNIWVAPDVDAKVEDNESALEEALRWAAGKRGKKMKKRELNTDLVVLAGSLYLVADFYQFLDQLI